MNRKREIQEQQYQQPYHWMLSKNLKALYDLRTHIVQTMASPLAGKQCLDVGCGDGKFASSLVASAAEVTGIDISEKALRFVQCLVPEVRFLKMDVTNLQFSDESFDVVTCLDTLEHLPDNEVRKAIAEMSRVLKRDGHLIVSVPSHNKKLEEKHYRHYNTDELQSVLKERFDEVFITGCAIYMPLIIKFLNYPKIWKLINKIMVKECTPARAITLVANATKR